VARRQPPRCQTARLQPQQMAPCSATCASRPRASCSNCRAARPAMHACCLTRLWARLATRALLLQPQQPWVGLSTCQVSIQMAGRALLVKATCRRQSWSARRASCRCGGAAAVSLASMLQCVHMGLSMAGGWWACGVWRGMVQAVQAVFAVVTCTVEQE
jgi:hypothetical protein